ncbi:MAG: TetR family transcriptional regulator C-terminal domain-containing protein [Nocardioidaceae bacterium]|nr:TetR family transcriptional regulator C-terminal domain-containing protein [Nocardioidaceae bacterium]
MARLTPARRRSAIVDAAVDVMLRRGMAATVRDVAEQMGTSSGLIHYYFASMDDLLAAGFEQAASRDLHTTREAMEGCDGAVSQLRTFFATYARAEQDWAFQLWLDAWAEAARRPAVRETSERLNVAWQRLLADTVRAGVVDGVLSCADPDGAAWRMLSLLDGLALQTVAHKDVIDRDAVVSWSVAYAERELGLARDALLP